jgi:hypothetical protein
MALGLILSVPIIHMEINKCHAFSQAKHFVESTLVAVHRQATMQKDS